MVMNADGSDGGPRAITHNGVDDFVPIWSPDGAEIAFTSARDESEPFNNERDAYIMDEDGTNVRRITTSGNIWATDWSPDGDYLLGWMALNDIVLITIADGTIQNLTNSPGVQDQQAHFSPDGTKVVFVSNPVVSFEFDVYTMNVDGTGFAMLVDTEEAPGWAVWGANDDIAYNMPTPPEYWGEIFIADAAGGTPQQLTPGASYRNETAAWSPDATHLLFTSDRTGDAGDLFVMNPDGTEQTQLTFGAGDEEYADWTTGSIAPPPPPDTASDVITDPEGGSVSTGPEATADDPVETTVDAPCCGSVDISEIYEIDQIAPQGYTFFGQQVAIEADILPPPTPDTPMTLTFRVDSSVIPAPGAIDISRIAVFRNAELVGECTADTEDSPATPDPCVSVRMLDGNGDLLLTVLTSQASDWNFGIGEGQGGGGDENPPQISISSPSDYVDDEPFDQVSPLEPGVYLLDSVVALIFECTDGEGFVVLCDGTYEDSSPAANGGDLDTSQIGTRTVTVTAQDDSGNQSQVSVTYRVVYDFSGFFQPVDNVGGGGEPVFNKVKAGSGVPVKFSLDGFQGLSIFGPDSPSSTSVACDTGAPTDSIEETVSVAGSALTYDATTDRYTWRFKTVKGWINTCRLLTVRLADDTVHLAYFRFT
jgi:Tol biopolymer transport system component